MEARLPYVTDGDGMHIFTDPADGETYVSAYIGMDVAQRVFACFDQNDLKATVDLTRDRRPARGPCSPTAGAERRTGAGGSRPRRRSRWRCSWSAPGRGTRGPGSTPGCRSAGTPGARSPPSSTATSSDLREVTEACFDHYATLFTEPYAFDSYDQAFVPGQNWGALETPGCVTYRDEYLPRGRLTDLMRIDRDLDDRARDGAHVVRRPGDDDLVGGHLAAGELRRLHGLPRRRRRARRAEGAARR